MPKSSWITPVVAGVVTAFVGFMSSFAVILKGLTAVGATDAQAASGLMALSIAMGLAGIVLSLGFRMPISSAWSTPGGALLASTGAVEGGFSAAVGGFLAVGLLIVAAGLIKPFGRAVAAIPSSLANAMLAGILFGLCLAPIKALLEVPLAAALVIVAWFVASRWRRLYATPVAALVAAGVIAVYAPHFELGALVPQPILVVPSFSPEAIVGIALPLFVVTMASQNLPGIAVLSAYDYRPPPGPLIAITGVFSALSAPFGGHAVNLSAITAAMCASPDASPDPARRWIAAATAGAVYVVLGLCAGGVTHFAAGSPILVEAVAGLALLNAFGSALQNAIADAAEREAAIATFLIAASGVSFHGVGGAFLGLAAGGLILFVTRAGAAAPRPPDRPR